MGAQSGSERLYRFRPDPRCDGFFEREGAAPLAVPPPDWDRALGLLRRINALRTADGRRVSALVVEEEFEPWWYSQDRLLRFYLVPLTQLLPLLEDARDSESIRVEGCPAELERVLRAIGGGMRPAVLLPPSRTDRTRGLKGIFSRTALSLLSSISLAAFRLARRDTVFYIVDHVSPGLRHDFRFAPLYRQFELHGVRFAEYAHTLSPRRAFGNCLRRRRPVVFLEAADEWARSDRRRNPAPEVPGLAAEPGRGGPVEERALAALVPTVLEWCADSAARQRMLKRVLASHGARRAVIFDDNRHNHELIAACRSLGIPVLGFQPGVFKKFHAGLMAYGFAGARPHAFDRYGVWSGLFRERLLRESALHTRESLFVAGPVRAPEGFPEDRPPAGEAAGAGSGASPARRIRVLVVSEPLARKREVAEYLRPLLADPRMEICLKLRPGESTRSLGEYGLPAERVRVLATSTVYEALAQADVALGTYSTVLYEAALALVPIVWLRTSRAYGRELAEEGLAETAGSPAELAAVLEKAAALSGEELRRRRALIWGERIADGAAKLMDVLAEMTIDP